MSDKNLPTKLTDRHLNVFVLVLRDLKNKKQNKTKKKKKQQNNNKKQKTKQQTK